MNNLINELESMANLKPKVSLNRLKINYVTDKKYARDDLIVMMSESKSVVKAGPIIIVDVWNKFSLYNPKDNRVECYSPYFKNGEVVTGVKYKNVCGVTCPYRVPDRDRKCSFENVYFCRVYTNEYGWIDAVWYVKGSNFVLFKEFINEMVKYKDGEVEKLLPTWAFIINKFVFDGKVIGSDEKYVLNKNETLKNVKMFINSDDILKEMKGYYEKVRGSVDEMNNTIKKLIADDSVISEEIEDEGDVINIENGNGNVDINDIIKNL